MTTTINQLIFDEKKEDKKYILSELSKEDLEKLIFNYQNVSERKRMQALEHFYIYYQEYIVTIINNLTMQFLISRTHTVESFMLKICLKSILSPLIKIECAKTLTLIPKHFTILNTVLRTFLKQKSYIIDIHFIDAVFFLSKNKKFQKETNQYLSKIVGCKNLTQDYIYKVILSISSKIANCPFVRSYLKFFNTI